MRNPAWQRDELILALDLYFRVHHSLLSQRHEDVITLSNILNKLPIHAVRPDKERFRNPNGVYMKINNFKKFDPTYKGVGLPHGNKLEKVVWNEFADKPEYLRKIAQRIIDSIDFIGENKGGQNEISEEEEEFPEGRLMYKQHRLRERNRKLVLAAKESAMKSGKLHCSVCGFDFYKTYGEVGKGYIQCHHTLPITEYEQKNTTKIKDLALVCANCHSMLHRRRPWLNTKDLSELILIK